LSSLSPLRSAQLALAIIPYGNRGLPWASVEDAIAGNSALLPYVISQSLGPLWASAPLPLLDSLGATAEAAEIFKAEHRHVIARNMLQRAVLTEALRALDSVAIQYAVFKGAHLRNWLYSEPSLRPSSDVDILVLPADRVSAVNALLAANFSSSADPASISHELTLLRHGVAIDLHWHVSRPGRLRHEITRELMDRRRLSCGFWTLSEADEVFLMLMHPAFTKYVSSPNMPLIRVVDFLYAVRDHAIDWDAVAALLEHCGVKTAGWCMLTWYQMLHPLAGAVPASFLSRLAPGRLRAWYLRLWLRKDWPTRLFRCPILIQMGLTLCLHDKLSDVGRALVSIIRARRMGRRDELMALARTHNASSK